MKSFVAATLGISCLVNPNAARSSVGGFELREQLAQHSEASVYRAKKNGDSFAVKVFNKGFERSVRHEWRMMEIANAKSKSSKWKKLNCAKSLKGCFTKIVKSDKKSFIAMPLYGKSLFQIIKEAKKNGKRISQRQIGRWTIQVLDMMQALTAKNIVHNDFKIQNVLLADRHSDSLNQALVLADFEYATEIGKHHKVHKFDPFPGKDIIKFVRSLVAAADIPKHSDGLSTVCGLEELAIYAKSLGLQKKKLPDYEMLKEIVMESCVDQ